MVTASAARIFPIFSSSGVTSFYPPPQLDSSTGVISVSIPNISCRLLLRSPAARRRDFLGVVGGVALASLLLMDSPDSKAREVEVGSYLPLFSSDPSFVLFRATPTDTPALRAGNVQPYEFILPPSWKQARVANILSGNYCQPKCAEPWVEVKFEDEKQGKVQVVASPLIRLTNKPNATIEDIGSPEKYYSYVLETPYALTGSHNLAKATAKGNTVVLFVASANDKQWPASQETLKAMVDSFQI